MSDAVLKVENLKAVSYTHLALVVELVDGEQKNAVEVDPNK